MYRYQFESFTLDTLVSFSTIYYKNFKPEKVPKEPTAFDHLLEKITQELKVLIFLSFLVLV